VILTTAPIVVAQQPPAPATAADVIAHVQSYWQNMQSYQVPIVMSGSVKVSFLSVPFRMDGTEYYEAPDKQALHLNNVPPPARGFENTVSNMGTPATWPLNYDITLKGTQPYGKHTAFVLVGTPKRGGNVKTMTMFVNVKTYAIEAVNFAYNNGASLVVSLSHHGLSPFHQATSATVDARFPGYTGSAQIFYGTYKFNVPIDPSVFEKR